MTLPDKEKEVFRKGLEKISELLIGEK